MDLKWLYVDQMCFSPRTHNKPWSHEPTTALNGNLHPKPPKVSHWYYVVMYKYCYASATQLLRVVPIFCKKSCGIWGNHLTRKTSELFYITHELSVRLAVIYLDSGFIFFTLSGGIIAQFTSVGTTGLPVLLFYI